jgi:hypothetical protein
MPSPTTSLVYCPWEVWRELHRGGVFYGSITIVARPDYGTLPAYFEYQIISAAHPGFLSGKAEKEIQLSIWHTPYAQVKVRALTHPNVSPNLKPSMFATVTVR